jgi:hypothetical protein
MRQAHSRKPASNIDQEVGTACSLKQQLATPIGVQSAYMFADYQSPKLEATSHDPIAVGHRAPSPTQLSKRPLSPIIDRRL